MKTLYVLFLLFAAFCLGVLYQSGEWGAPLVGLVGLMLTAGVAAVTLEGYETAHRAHADAAAEKHAALQRAEAAERDELFSRLAEAERLLGRAGHLVSELAEDWHPDSEVYEDAEQFGDAVRRFLQGESKDEG